MTVTVTEFTEIERDINLLLKSFKIFGTGFLVADGLVLTNRHVIRAAEQETKSRRLPLDRRCAMFMWSEGSTPKMTLRFFSDVAVSEDLWADLAVGILGQVSDAARVPVLSPVRLADEIRAYPGMEIGAYGYASAMNLMRRERPGLGTGDQVYRMGPVLRRGWISAIAPYDESRAVGRLLLDFHSHHGMSGSPVFDYETGEVIGIHTSGTPEAAEYAIPLTNGSMEPWKTVLASGAYHNAHVSFGPIYRRPDPL